MLAALGNTPLMVAAGSPTGSAAIEQLLAAKADITLRNKGGRTALRFAAGGGDVRTVRLLLEKAKSMGRFRKSSVLRGRRWSLPPATDSQTLSSYCWPWRHRIRRTELAATD